MPDGTKVHPADVEQALTRDARVRDAAVVGLERPGSEVQVHAVLILHDPTEADDVVRQANTQLGGHQQIRGFTVWPEDEFPRTPTLKVKKPEILKWILAAKTDEAPPSGTDAPAAAGSPIERLVAQLDGVHADAIRPDARLSTDLGIDSLGRVELLGMVEESLGVYIDDGELDPEETLEQLQARVDAAPPNTAAPEGIFGWPLNPVVGALRIGLQTLIILPLVSLFYRRPVRGLEHLDGLQGPVMFAANHHLHNDNALILMAIPVGWRWKLSVAAAADDIFGSWWRGTLSAILGNAFPHGTRGRRPPQPRPAGRAPGPRLQRADLPGGQAHRRRPAAGVQVRHRPGRHPRRHPGRADPTEGPHAQPDRRGHGRHGLARRGGGGVREAAALRDRRRPDPGHGRDPRRHRGALGRLA